MEVKEKMHLQMAGVLSWHAQPLPVHVICLVPSTALAKLAEYLSVQTGMMSCIHDEMFFEDFISTSFVDVKETTGLTNSTDVLV